MKMAKLTRTIVALVLVMGLVCAAGLSASACTGFYIGKDLTENGSTIWGRTEDVSANYSKLYVVRPAATHEPGEKYVFGDGFVYPYPEKTLRFTICRDSNFNEQRNYNDPYGEVGMNEKNVAITATVTLSGAKSAITALDPMVRGSAGGISEASMASVILMQATSARHAIEILADAIDTYGTATRDGFTVSDPNEVWYFESLSGHQYVAVKAPSNKVGLSPNITTMGAVDVTDTENVIASPNLVSLAQQAGTLVTDSEGRIKVNESYANTNSSIPSRMWQGTYYLRGAEAANSLTSGYYQYFTDGRASGNYTLFEAMRLLAYRGEDSDNPSYNSNLNSSTRAIGGPSTVEANVFETRHDMPDELAIVEWLAMGPAEFSVYVPYYGSLITDTYAPYWNADSKTFNPNSFSWVFRQLYTLCAGNRTNYGANVVKFWNGYQKKLIEQQAAIDKEMVTVLAYSPELASEKATALGKVAAKGAFETAQSILTELQAFKDAGTEGVFTPSALTDNVQPNYTFDAVGGTGLPTLRYSANIGDTITVPVMLKGCEDVSGLQGTIHYDNSLLTLQSVTPVRGFMADCDREKNTFIAIAPNGAGKSGDVTFGYALFTVAGELPDDDVTTYVRFDNMKIKNSEGATIVNQKVEGIEITVLSKAPQIGDVNLDGEIDVSDAIALMQYLAGSKELSKKALGAADANKDGKVNVGDVTIIMQMCL